MAALRKVLGAGSLKDLGEKLATLSFDRNHLIRRIGIPLFIINGEHDTLLGIEDSVSPRTRVVGPIVHPARAAALRARSKAGGPSMSAEAVRPESVQRTDVTFLSAGTTCAAWFYKPRSPSGRTLGLPLVVLGHGLGATRDLGLDSYARRFAAAGFGALAFDYRYFGASQGEPRQLLAVRRQLADWAAAVSFARTLPGIDPGRIAIWGSSFAGGHVIRVAARDSRIAAVVSQCPFTSGPASVRALGLKSVLKVMPLALADQAAELVGGRRTLVELVGPPGSAGLMTARDAEPGYRALIPPEIVFEDRVAARIGLWIGLYSPGRAARRVSCPILFCICDRDSLAPAGPTARYAARAHRGEVRHYPVGHFDVYLGAPFERAIADQIDFLKRHLSN